ncbi:MAG: hypothetical protein HDQ88_10810 [Clostridia bacterium]|nr:hypothetical protein [Clostridia bacterium]
MRGEAAFVGDTMMDSPRPSASYATILLELLPLLGLAFSIGILRGLKGIKESYTGTSFFNRFINVVLTSAVGAVFAVGCALLIPLLHTGVDENMMVGVVVFVSLCGVRLVDAVCYKYLGIHVISADESDDPDDNAWSKMSQEERHECMKMWQDHNKGE